MLKPRILSFRNEGDFNVKLKPCSRYFRFQAQNGVGRIPFYSTDFREANLLCLVPFNHLKLTRKHNGTKLGSNPGPLAHIHCKGPLCPLWHCLKQGSEMGYIKMILSCYYLFHPKVGRHDLVLQILKKGNKNIFNLSNPSFITRSELLKAVWP